MSAPIPDLQRLIERAEAEGFDTDPDAAPGSFEHRLHEMRERWNAARGAGPSGSARFDFLPGRELLTKTIAGLMWVVFGFLPRNSVIVIAGEPKTSKTWLALTMALAVSAQQALFSIFRVGEGTKRVNYFALEDSERSFRTRLVALARGMGLEPAVAVENISVNCRTSLNLRNDADLCALAASCPPAGPDGLELLIIDPIRDAHDADENSSGEMSDVMRRLRWLRDVLGCTVVFVHHAAKSSPDKASRRPGQMMRGSSAVHGAVDGGIYLSMKSATEAAWTNAVQVELKAGRGAGTFNLTLDVEDDENGEARVARWTYVDPGEEQEPAPAEELRSIVLEVLKAGPVSGSAIARRLRRSKEAVLTALEELNEAGAIVRIGRTWEVSGPVRSNGS